MPTKATWQKLQIFKIQDGGWPPFWKLSNRHISVKNIFSLSFPIAYCTGLAWSLSYRESIIIWWNMAHYSRYWTRWQSRYQKLKFLKFKMAATAILKIAFIAITHRPIVRFQRNFVWGSWTACRQRPRHKNCKLQNPRFRTAAILKIVNHYISVKILSDFDKIWYTTADVEPDEILKSTIAVF